MAYYRQVGDVPPKRHTQFRDEHGALRYEELMGEEGFSSDSSLLYHRGVPSAIVDSQVWELPDLTTTPNHPLKPRHLKLHDLGVSTGSTTENGSTTGDGSTTGNGSTTDAVTGRRLVLGNGDVRISYVVATEPSPLYRNAVGDECVFVETGSGTVETVFGVLSYRAGDYVVVPRATTHRWVPAEESRLYPIEANSHIAPPKRYLSKYGQLLEHAPYCERDLHGPTEPFLVDSTTDGVSTGSTTGDGSTDVYVKHRGSGPSGLVGTRMTYATHPFDVVGWDGCLYPYTFNVEDYMPITGKIHQPPPVHQVFEGWNFVICNFLPRKVDYHPLSIPVPYYHSNVDSDEVMFYVAGDYEARKGSGIGRGSISLHPGGYAHGPLPQAIEASLGAEYFDETAVMVDTFRPLELGEGALACEDPAYAWTWSGRGPDSRLAAPADPTQES
ncbi:homogentisate 1,2-dioxygenase [Nocardioides sp. HDW12B]|uniref:homogentisate 1,2-dioxygenase n=1 Tax=Nocardioides sp. HDW12B TaxID=2714939 RepID=UPI0014079F87|nr:homogentisate 1,2-dioxygenase domain-containing protein [Nocardioides sp. HDW12B]QIK65682.1 homogentisate 1,2-dioxygenase [Nocardioides sp. HDW12B]